MDLGWVPVFTNSNGNNGTGLENLAGLSYHVILSLGLVSWEFTGQSNGCRLHSSCSARHTRRAFSSEL